MRRAAGLLLQKAATAARECATGRAGAADGLAVQQRHASAAAGGARKGGGPVRRPTEQMHRGRGGAAFEAAPIVLTAEELAARERTNYLLGAGLIVMSAYGYYIVSRPRGGDGVPTPSPEHLVNWSGTHECQVQRFYQPETLEQLEATVKQAHTTGRKLRCVGSGLSPNGLAFSEDGMVSLGLMDKVLDIDTASGQVRVQAGARVQAVADELRGHGLTLQNYASIREQTVGGFIQVSAHGTGAAIPPVDEQVVALKLVTPALGTLELSKDQDPELFQLAKVGLGCLGVVAEVTLQCVPAHRLLERTTVNTAREVRKAHAQRLRDNKHLRYMWIPSTDAVVVVTCNEVAEGQEPAVPASKYSEEQQLAPLRTLLRSRLSAEQAAEVNGLSATQCRDRLLALGPLDAAWVKRVNQAEAEHWRRCEGTRVGWSDELLGFDCGGQQWVLETAFPAGTIEAPDGRDLAYMDELLRLVASHNVPAPAPIEQRWTAGSSASMSPAAGAPGSLHSWVGVIMYLAELEPEQRQAVTKSFQQYAELVERQLMPKYGAVAHWAKIEVPSDPAQLAAMQQRLASRYPVAAFNAARRRLDPHNILGSPMMDALLPHTAAPAEAVAA
ncbi:L-galactono-1 [Chlorella vulgaris]